MRIEKNDQLLIAYLFFEMEKYVFISLFSKAQVYNNKQQENIQIQCHTWCTYENGYGGYMIYKYNHILVHTDKQ